MGQADGLHVPQSQTCLNRDGREKKQELEPKGSTPERKK